MRKLNSRPHRLVCVWALLLIAASAFSVQATEISVSGFQTIASYRYAGTTASVRFYASETFTTSDGKLVVGTLPGSLGFYASVSCTIAGNILNCPGVALPSTTDSSRPLAGYTAVLYDARGIRRETLFDRWRVPHTLGAGITYGQLEAYNRAPVRPFGDAFYTRDQVNALINQQTAPDASLTVKGKSRLSVAPVIGSDPVAVGDNDPRLIQTPPLEASSAVKGVTKLSVAPVSAANPIAVGDNDVRLTPATGGRAVYANQFPGASAGDKIRAALTALGTDRGTIYHYGGGAIPDGAEVILSPNQTLVLGCGTYTTSAFFAPWRPSSNSSIIGSGSCTILEENPIRTSGSGFFVIVTAAQATSNGSNAEGIHVKNLQVRGTGTNFESSAQSISLGNCHNCSVTDVSLVNTHAIGLQIGGGSGIGVESSTAICNAAVEECRNARFVTVANVRFYGVGSQNFAIVNARNVTAANLVFDKPGQPGGPSVTVIDLEPNVPEDILRDIVISNFVIDATASPISINGVAVQNTISPTAVVSGIIIKDFVIRGGELAGEGGAMSNGIQIYGPVSNSYFGPGLIQRAQQAGIVIQNNVYGQPSFNTVAGVQIISSGTGGVEAFALNDTNNNFIHDNIVRKDPASSCSCRDRISESGSSAGNRFWNNTASMVSVGSNSQVLTNFAISSGLLSFKEATGVGTESPTFGLHLKANLGLSKIATTGAPTVLPRGTPGSTSYTYYVVAVALDGTKTVPSAAGSTATGNATLLGTNHNLIYWTRVDGAAYYEVLRSTTGQTIGVAYDYPDPSGIIYFLDTGQASSGYTPATRNSTADVIVEGRITATESLIVGAGGSVVTGIFASSGSVDFATAGANTCETATLGVSSAAEGDAVTLGVAAELASHNTTATFTAWISAANVVSVRRCVVTADETDPATAIIKALVIKF